MPQHAGRPSGDDKLDIAAISPPSPCAGTRRVSRRRKQPIWPFQATRCLVTGGPGQCNMALTPQRYAAADREGPIMKKLIAALLLLPLTQSVAVAQQAGNAAQGKAYWDSNLTACKNCHGGMAEGAFGPDLAGRGLNAGQVYRAVHQPWGIMPAFIEGQLNQQQAADLAAYFASMPKPAEPGKWRFEAPANAPAGLATLVNMGCAQCHSPLFQGPRGNLGAVNADFDYFANLVYNH